MNKFLEQKYSEKVISQLLKKFIGYDSTADNRDKIIDHKLVNMVYDFIKTFDKIKNSPNIAKKDIFTYTLPELEEVVLNYMKNMVIHLNLKFQKHYLMNYKHYLFF